MRVEIIGTDGRELTFNRVTAYHSGYRRDKNNIKTMVPYVRITRWNVAFATDVHNYIDEKDIYTVKIT